MFESLESRRLLAAGPELLLDINPRIIGSASPNGFTRFGDATYFAANDAEHGRELWRVDAEGLNPQLVVDLEPGSDGSQPTHLTAFGDRLFFVAETATATHRYAETQWQLWSTDMIGAQVHPVRDSAGNALSWPNQFGFASMLEADGKLYFVANDVEERSRLWVLDPFVEADGASLTARRVNSSVDVVLSHLNYDLNRYAFETGGRLVFTGRTQEHGSELWASDGSTVERLTDVLQGELDGVKTLSSAVVVDDLLLFLGVDGSIWSTDGTATGTQLFREVYENEYHPHELTSFQGELFFLVSPKTSVREMRRIDLADAGSRAGVTVETDVDAIVRPVNDRLLFLRSTEEHNDVLWATDGTPQDAELLVAVEWSSDLHLETNLLHFDGELLGNVDGEPIADQFFFTTGHRQRTTGELALWVSDGTSAGTVELETGLALSTAIDGKALVYWHSQFDGRVTEPLLYSNVVSTVSRSRDLWRSDGTADGTFRVAQLNKQTGSSSTGWLRTPHVVGDWTYFTAFDGESRGLWRTDGTTENTTLLHPLDPDRLFWGIAGVYENTIYLSSFASSDQTPTLWKTDGNNVLEVALTLPDNPATAGRSDLHTLRNLFIGANDRFFYSTFRGFDQTDDFWIADGAGNTEQIPATSVRVLGNFQGETYYVTDSSKLWSRGSGPSRLVKDFTDEPMPTDRDDARIEFQFLFEANDALHIGRYQWQGSEGNTSPGLRQVWRTDGTVEGTQLIEFPIWPTDPVALGEDRLIFATSNDSVARLDLWVSDGTSENTTHLKKFVWPDFTSWPITPNVRIANLTAAGDLVYFTAGDEEHGNELWRTDGTIEGTRLVSDIVLGPISSDPGNLATVGERLYFTASNGDGAPNDEIWTTDGTGTRRLFDFDEGWPNCRYSRFDGCYPETGVGFFPTSHGILIPYNDDRYGNELFVLSGELPPLGDVGGDGAVNSLDIDELQYTIRETYEYDAWWGTSYPFRDTSAVFDLNFDVVVDEQDVDWLVEEILKTRRGDLNLDRKVDFADFLMLSANFGMTNATWAMGDIDGDGAVLENDFAILRDAFGSSPSVTVGVAVSRT